MIHSRKTHWHHVLFLLLCAMTLMVAGCATQNAASVGADGTMVVKGKVIRIALDAGLITIKPPRGAEVTVKLTPTTTYHNLPSATAIKMKQPLEVRYRVEGQENLAISITPVPEGSC